jgi:hypothetical protein
MMDMGMSLERKKGIQPYMQKAIKYDLMDLFIGGVDRQEHIINVGMWSKKTKSIFSNVNSSALTEELNAVGGEALTRYISNQIDTVVSPYSHKGGEDGSDLLKTLRGKLMMAMLAGRVPTFMVQMVTSPMITLAYAPRQFFQVLKEVYSDPAKMWQWTLDIEKKSAILANRSLHPELARLRQLEEQGLLSGAMALTQKAFIPLNFADRLSCAIEWEAIYRRAILPREEGGYSKDADEAMHDADKIIIQTQPSSEEWARSPLYRDMDSWKGTLLQFTNPLNVIWNNLRYDVPRLFDEHKRLQAVGVIACYALSGLAIGVVKSAFSGITTGLPPGAKDDDDPVEVWERYFATYFFSQYVDSVPLAGPYLSSLIRSTITGQKPFSMSPGIPLLEEASKVGESVRSFIVNPDGFNRDRYLNLLYSGLMTGGLALGLPSLGLVELIKGGVSIYDIGKGN